MDFSQFDQRTKDDPRLSAFVQEMAGEISPQEPTERSERYVVIVDDVLIGLAAYTLFRWAKYYLDNHRADNETKIAERRVRIITGLVADGFTPEQAQSATEGLFKQIAKRTEDDPMLQATVKMIGTGGS